MGGRLMEGLSWAIVVAVTFTVLSLATGCAYLPDGLRVHVSERGCLPSGECPYGGVAPANFYHPGERTVVLAPDQGARTVLHELCHAHQHATVLEELGVEPSVDLREWHETEEGRSFDALTAEYPHPWSWVSQDDVSVEDFANTCALFVVDPEELKARSQERYRWVADRTLLR